MSLEDLAGDFADSLTTTTRAVVGRSCPQFTATAVGDEPSLFTVWQGASAGIPLAIDGTPTYLLRAEYDCCLDREEEYLRVDASRMTLFYSPNESHRHAPLIRYEFQRAARSVPVAHFHVHGSGTPFDDGPTDMDAVIAMSGGATRRGRVRQADIDRGKYPRHQDFHYPLGGERFRPCLEDLLEALISELGIDHEDGWRGALIAGRVAWRLQQTAAAVRDAPETAAATLRKLKYTVAAPPSGPVLNNIERLRAF
ncbi:hypothetical protein GCG21_03865 [Pseudactinotalea sp. HY160]|uniref:hypothetical protein n=1 Tax=Pseudactinotalea sp. HY160 TaxID=2654490 RepID=UPI00128D5EF0|nr:hypothetical protein [Pseudactinotalea sp. HY160]MPV49154.1 hypothetical protein [Pseudactinotalea sp. HY160]